MPERDFGAKVPEREYERFRANFPQYGATTWFINTALRRFNDEVERNPTAADLVDVAISGMVEVNRIKAELNKRLGATDEQQS